MQLALRDLRDEFSRVKVLAALAGVAVVVGISGPFGTLEAFSLLPRMAYWAAVVPLTYGAGFLGTHLATPFLPRRPLAARIALAALGSALMVALVLGALNLGLGLDLGGTRDFALGFVAVYIICLVIEALAQVMRRQTPAEQASAPPAILLRLPLTKRGALLALTAEDHYTTVITTKGREMLLIRLADAIAETAPVAGLQIHRSHWVALGQVAQATGGSDGGEVVLTNGDVLPIARARMMDARKIGLLPHKGE